MITGDHKQTARAIAGEAGIYREGDESITGVDLAKLPQRCLRKICLKFRFCARHAGR